MEWILLVALVVGAVIATFFVMARASKGYERARARREGGPPVRHCSTCKSQMDFSGLREIAPLGRSVPPEQMALESYQCPTCRKVEFFLPPAALE